MTNPTTAGADQQVFSSELSSGGRATGRLINAGEASELLGVPKSWVLAQARRDALPNIKLGHYRRFDRDELLAWALARQRGPLASGR